LPPEVPSTSAGILLFREDKDGVQVLLIRPGGPYWSKRHQGAWMIPKGGLEPGETAIEAALREFEEELGIPVRGVPVHLCRVRQAGGKWVDAFAAQGDLDTDSVCSNRFELEWPPKSGTLQSFPEVQEARWMSIAEAREMMLPSQVPILDALEQRLAGESG
jgi:predicted NUDIX family NTP pyrophosphohydrolase